MPIYEYKCQNGHTFEVMQRIADDPVQVCDACEAPVERVFHPVAIHFKGSGFYNTDYGTRKRQRENKESAEKSSSESKSDSKSESKSESKSDSKPDKKTESKAA